MKSNTRLGGVAALSLWLGACTGQVGDQDALAPTGSGGQSTDGSSSPGSGGTAQIDFKGSPAYLRIIRLTNEQWRNSVKDLFGIADAADLAGTFRQPSPSNTDFVNNELLLNVDTREWSDYQGAAETIATRVTASDSALAKIYSGTDAAGFIGTVGRRAYRRPLTTAETSTYATLFTSGSSLSGSRSAFAKGASLVIRALLQSPYFVYRNELTDTGRPLSSYEMAAKLSLLFRNTTPNDALLDAAAGPGKLDTAAGAVAAAKTMLEEEPAVGVMRDFHGQYLHFDGYAGITKVDTPTFNTAINAELQESSYLFFDKVFSKGLGLREVLTSTSGYVGPNMAKLYGVSAPSSGYAERDLGSQRVGYFSQLPFLLLNAHNGDPDAIHRGVSMSHDVLCAVLGPPADVIPPLQTRLKGETSRAVVDKSTSGCGQSCHNDMINPLGFAFEHFDGMGKYRDSETWMGEALPIDSSGAFNFVDGRKTYKSATELMKLLGEGSQAHLCYAKKIASYGLQRDIVAADMPLLTTLATTSRTGSLKQMVLDLVGNDAFRTRKGGSL